MYKMIRIELSLILFFFMLFNVANAQSLFIVSSPDGNLQVQLSEVGEAVNYQVFWNGEAIVNSSEISILPGTASKIQGSTTSTKNETWKPVWGQFSEITDHYNELTLDIALGEASAKLIARVYDHGLGFRYELMGLKAGAEANLYCEYNLDGNDSLYFPSGENPPVGPLAINELAASDETPKLRMPIVVETKKPYLSILESDLFSAPAFDVISLSYDQNRSAIVSSNTAQVAEEKLISPWRVILVNEQIGDLVTNTVTLNLAAPNQIEDPSWIKPGKTMWDWRVHGYTAPDGFTYGINTESYMRFIDFAADMGIEYFLIDDSWYKKVTPANFELSEKLDLQKVIDYAAEKDVELMLYYDRRHGEYGDEELFEYYKSLGMKGIKYGFMGQNVPFSRDAIASSAKSQLLIDFHDSPVPFTGIERTYANAITKEYCHAQQDSRKAFTPETFIKMALINAIQGPLDMNNGNFDLSGINRGDREKGPKITDSYVSTVVSEAARTLIIHSGLVCIPDAPEEYLEKADLFEFIQKQPVGKWDESMILDAKMGEYITTARRQGDSWFIGSVHDQQGGTLDIALDFLQPGKEYQVTYYEDTDETHGKTNPEAYQVRSGEVKKGDIVHAKMAPGGGHCMWIRAVE
ncbi:alpha-glucosidase [Algoriphagus ratkowskyi]|uniref:Alpha-glucosidase n=3 Tax=Algoriphagus ratkowskyi TaxID=57028 RepID=A0A2W7RBE9_9BACT|nr:alpha-glucosidase [Algoriphagus ratkowskyi]